MLVAQVDEWARLDLESTKNKPILHFLFERYAVIMVDYIHRVSTYKHRLFRKNCYIRGGAQIGSLELRRVRNRASDQIVLSRL